jgi:hypothetical protein
VNEQVCAHVCSGMLATADWIFTRDTAGPGGLLLVSAGHCGMSLADALPEADCPCTTGDVPRFTLLHCAGCCQPPLHGHCRAEPQLATTYQRLVNASVGPGWPLLTTAVERGARRVTRSRARARAHVRTLCCFARPCCLQSAPPAEYS